MTAKHVLRKTNLWALNTVLVLGSGTSSAQQLCRLTEITAVDGGSLLAAAINGSGQATGSHRPEDGIRCARSLRLVAGNDRNIAMLAVRQI